MNTTGIIISPVNMEDRVALGVKAGDTVRVHQKIQDKGKMRIQIFEGLVLAVKHGTEPGATFTVRKMVDGIGVEKIYPLYSPAIDKIEITRRSKVRSAKLYHIREKVAREAKRQMRRMTLTSIATESGIEVAQKKEALKTAEAAKKAALEAEETAKQKAVEDAENERLATEAAAKEAEEAVQTPEVEVVTEAVVVETPETPEKTETEEEKVA